MVIKKIFLLFVFKKNNKHNLFTSIKDNKIKDKLISYKIIWAIVRNLPNKE